jgi:hypothetical protein
VRGREGDEPKAEAKQTCTSGDLGGSTSVTCLRMRRSRGTLGSPRSRNDFDLKQEQASRGE